MKLTNNSVAVRFIVTDTEKEFMHEGMMQHRMKEFRRRMADHLVDRVEFTEQETPYGTEYRARLYVFTPEELESFIAYIDKTKTPTEE